VKQRQEVYAKADRIRAEEANVLTLTVSPGVILSNKKVNGLSTEWEIWDIHKMWIDK
jgi:hypothetical protein